MQKLQKGNRVIKSIGKKSEADRARNELTKRITARIEQTMAARASTDGGGLNIVNPEEGEGKMLRANSLMPTNGSKGANKR